jgi:hypothetical protein
LPVLGVDYDAFAGVKPFDSLNKKANEFIFI